MKQRDRYHARRAQFAESNDYAVTRGMRHDVVGELDFEDRDRRLADGALRTVFDRSRWALRRQ